MTALFDGDALRHDIRAVIAESDRWIAGEVRAAVARARCPQALIAQALRTSQQAVSRRLNGHTPFRAPELAVIADVLGVPITSLFPATS